MAFCSEGAFCIGSVQVSDICLPLYGLICMLVDRLCPPGPPRCDRIEIALDLGRGMLVYEYPMIFMKNNALTEQKENLPSVSVH